MALKKACAAVQRGMPQANSAAQIINHCGSNVQLGQLLGECIRLRTKKFNGFKNQLGRRLAPFEVALFVVVADAFDVVVAACRFCFVC